MNLPVKLLPITPKSETTGGLVLAVIIGLALYQAHQLKNRQSQKANAS